MPPLRRLCPRLCCASTLAAGGLDVAPMLPLQPRLPRQPVLLTRLVDTMVHAPRPTRAEATGAAVLRAQAHVCAAHALMR